MFIASVTVVAVVCYFVFEDAGTLGTWYFATELLLLPILCVVVVAAAVKFRQLRFVFVAESCLLDYSLLVIAVCGVFVLECFHLVSSLSTITTGLMSLLSAITAALSSVQVQTLTLKSD